MMAFKKIWYDQGFAFIRSTQIDDLVGGHTALHVACRQGYCDIIRELLERGANMDILVGNKKFLFNPALLNSYFLPSPNYCNC